jgi:hypothetical protein
VGEPGALALPRRVTTVAQRYFFHTTLLLPPHTFAPAQSLVKNWRLHGFLKAWVCALLPLPLASRTDDDRLGIILDGDTLMLSDEDDLEKDQSSREGGNTSLNTALNAIRESLAPNLPAPLVRFDHA